MPKIEEMYVFIAEDGPNDEGVSAFQIGDTWLPMVGADMKRVDSMKPVAQLIADRTGQTIKLIRFTQREEIETIEPRNLQGT